MIPALLHCVLLTYKSVLREHWQIKTALVSPLEATAILSKISFGGQRKSGAYFSWPFSAGGGCPAFFPFQAGYSLPWGAGAERCIWCFLTNAVALLLQITEMTDSFWNSLWMRQSPDAHSSGGPGQRFFMSRCVGEDPRLRENIDARHQLPFHSPERTAQRTFQEEHSTATSLLPPLEYLGTPLSLGWPFERVVY